MKIVVTGGAGLIGSNLVAKLVEMNFKVTVIDNLWRGSIENLKNTLGTDFDKIDFINDDIAYLGDWMASLRNADCVFHLADIVAGIGYVFQNESSIFRKNLQINASITSACELMKVKRYVYVGTACSFPKELQYGVHSAPLREIDQFPANPESAYGWSKLMGELDATYLQKYADIPSVILVLHNVYGSPCDFSSKRAQVIPSLVYKALLSRQIGGELDVWGDGSQGRAFIHVSDVVKGLISSLERGDGQGAIQLGPQKCTSIREVAEKIVAKVDKQISIKYDVSKPTGDLGRSADFSKAMKLLGWSPTIDLDSGLSSLIEWIDNRMKV